MKALEGTLLRAMQDVNEAFAALSEEIVKQFFIDLKKLRRLLP